MSSGVLSSLFELLVVALEALVFGLDFLLMKLFSSAMERRLSILAFSSDTDPLRSITGAALGASTGAGTSAGTSTEGFLTVAVTGTTITWLLSVIVSWDLLIEGRFKVDTFRTGGSGGFDASNSRLKRRGKVSDVPLKTMLLLGRVLSTRFK